MSHCVREPLLRGRAMKTVNVIEAVFFALGWSARAAGMASNASAKAAANVRGRCMDSP